MSREDRNLTYPGYRLAVRGRRLSNLREDLIRQPFWWYAHYTRAEVALNHILPAGKLRMSPYRNMRDPVENKDLTLVTGLAGTSLAASPGIARLRDLHGAIRLLSFTAGHDEYGSDALFSCAWARPRMWEQYADQHKGVCLLFWRYDLDESLRSELGRLGRYYLRRVRYTPGGFATSQGRGSVISLAAHDVERSAILGELHTYRSDFFFLKASDWASETEYRAVLMEAQAEYAFVSYGRGLVALVLGELFPSSLIPIAEKACADAGVALRLITWSDGIPSLEEVD